MKAFSQTLSFCFWFCSALALPGKVSGSSGRIGGGACSLKRQCPGGLPLAALAPGKAQKVSLWVVPWVAQHEQTFKGHSTGFR